jgi:hypothetical protein
VGVRLLLAASAIFLLVGCEVYAVPDPIACPGERQGTFDFAAIQTPSPTDCFFAQPGFTPPLYESTFTFTGTVNFGPGATDAAICVATAHAMPRLGTHAGLAVDVKYTSLTGSVGACTCPTPEAASAGKCNCSPGDPTQNCSCPVSITERIVGDLVPITGGYSGFTGTQVVTVKPLPGLPLPAQPCDCQVECTFSYAVTATSVGSR